jgi:hypothetical protein
VARGVCRSLCHRSSESEALCDVGPQRDRNFFNLSWFRERHRLTPHEKCSPRNSHIAAARGRLVSRWPIQKPDATGTRRRGMTGRYPNMAPTRPFSRGRRTPTELLTDLVDDAIRELRQRTRVVDGDPGATTLVELMTAMVLCVAISFRRRMIISRYGISAAE